MLLYDDLLGYAGKCISQQANFRNRKTANIEWADPKFHQFRYCSTGILTICHLSDSGHFKINRTYLLKLVYKYIARTMAVQLLFVFLVLFLQPSYAEKPPLKLTFCKPRSLVVRFKANRRPLIRLYRACPVKNGSFNCGGPVTNVIRASCTRTWCPPGIRCKKCSFRIRPWQLPRFYHNQGSGLSPTLGKYRIEIFGPEFCLSPPLVFDSDFFESGADWFARNNFIAGCKNRVNCYTWRKECNFQKPFFNLALYAQGCTTTLVSKFNQLTAESVQACYNRQVVKGIPANEVIGKGCKLDSRII